MIRLIVGLGNPGAKYAGTRHNVGFEFLERYAAHLGIQFVPHQRYKALIAQVPQGGPYLMLPQTYMNLSGQAVSSFVRYHPIDSDGILVVHDDVAFPVSTIRIKKGGGHAGHNGIKNIREQLGNAEFYRLRIGVGIPPTRDDLVPFVLSRPPPNDIAALEQVYDRVQTQMPAILAGQWGSAQQDLHTAPNSP